MSVTGIRDGEPFDIEDTELGRDVAAQIILILQRVDVDDLLDKAVVTFEHDEHDPKKVSLSLNITKTITHGDYLAASSPYPLMGLARRVARMPAGVRARYREQWAKHPIGIGASIPIHPDTVDLWAAEIDKAGR